MTSVEKNEIKIGSILSYIIIILNMIIGIAYTPILTKALGQSEYGLYSLISSIISYLTILDFGFGNAIIVYTSKYREKKEFEKEKKLYGMFLIIYTIIGIIAGIIGIFIATNIENIFANTMSPTEISKAKILMVILTINLVVTFPFSLFSSIITAYEKFVFQKSINIIRIILQPIIMIVLLNYGHKSISLVTVITILNVFTLLSNYFYCKKRLKIKIIFDKFDKILFKNMCTYSIWIFLNMIMDKVNWTLDQTILGIFSGTTAVSIYSIASQLDMMFMNFSIAISGVLLPKISKMEAKNASDEEFSDIFIKIGRIQYIILALILSGFILFGKEFITITWLGKDYNQSYYIALILMIPSIFSLCQNTGLSILQAKNKYKYRVKVLFIFAIINAILSIILSQKFGAIGAASGTALSIICGQIIFMNWFYAKKINLNIKLFWKELLKITIPTLIAASISLLIKIYWQINTTKILIFQIIIYVLLYAIIMVLFGFNEYEKNLFYKNLLKKLKLRLEKKYE